MWVRSLGQEDPPEEGMATHSSIPGWEIPWMEDPPSMGSQRVGHNWRNSTAQRSRKTVLCSQKDTGEPIRKALTFKAMTLSIQRAKTLQSREWCLSCWKFTGASCPDLWGEPQEQRTGTLREATPSYTASHLSRKEAWPLTQRGCSLECQSLSSLLAFQLKSLFLCPNSSSLSLLACPALSSEGKVWGSK